MGKGSNFLFGREKIVNFLHMERKNEKLDYKQGTVSF